MITDYSQFDYNQTFLYNYNIFNNSKNIGIGTNTPSHILEVHNNINTIGNINITGNILLKNPNFPPPNTPGWSAASSRGRTTIAWREHHTWSPPQTTGTSSGRRFVMRAIAGAAVRQTLPAPS